MATSFEGNFCLNLSSEGEGFNWLYYKPFWNITPDSAISGHIGTGMTILYQPSGVEHSRYRHPVKLLKLLSERKARAPLIPVDSAQLSAFGEQLLMSNTENLEKLAGVLNRASQQGKEGFVRMLWGNQPADVQSQLMPLLVAKTLQAIETQSE